MAYDEHYHYRPRGRHASVAKSRVLRRTVLVTVLLLGIGGGFELSAYARASWVPAALNPARSTPTPTPQTTAAATFAQVSPSATPSLTPSATPSATVSAAAKPVARKLRIMPLGDSITWGNYYAGAYRVSLWKKLVTSDHLKVNFVGSESNGPAGLGDHDVEAFSGWRTDQFNANVTGWLKTYKPDVVLLQTGSSDLEQGASAATATKRLDTLLATMYRAKPKLMVVVSTTTPEEYNGTWNSKKWRDYDAKIPGLVTKYKNAGRHAYLADMHAKNFSFGAPDISPDGVHPTSTGYLKMTAAWYPVLKPLFYTSAS